MTLRPNDQSRQKEQASTVAPGGGEPLPEAVREQIIELRLLASAEKLDPYWQEVLSEAAETIERLAAGEAAAQQERARRKELDAKLSVVVECFRAWCRTPDIGVDADTEHALHELRDAFDRVASRTPPPEEER